MSRSATAATQTIREMRDLLFAHATDYAGARDGFAWPEVTEFNFALEWFDVVATENPARPAVQIVSADLSVQEWTYGDLSARSDQVATWLTDLGIRRGDHVIVMLGNTIELWEVMLAITKIGAVSIPTSTLLSASDLAYRIEHARGGRLANPGNQLQHAEPGQAPGRILGKAQKRQHVLDMRGLQKLQAAELDERDVAPHELEFERGAMAGRPE